MVGCQREVLVVLVSCAVACGGRDGPKLEGSDVGTGTGNGNGEPEPSALVSAASSSSSGSGGASGTAMDSVSVSVSTITAGFASTSASASASAGTSTTGADSGPGYRNISDDELAEIESEACIGMSSEYELLPKAIQFVVDIGGSMARQAADGQGSNFSQAQSALRDVIAALPPAFAVGLSFYPNQAATTNLTEPLPSEACVDTKGDIAPDLLGGADSEHRQALDSALLNAVPLPETSTPLRDAYALALSTLDSVDTSSGLSKVLALVSDGEPTLDYGCLGVGLPGVMVDTSGVIHDIAMAREAGVATLVIGGPGSSLTPGGLDARTWLSDAARAGRAGEGCLREPHGHIDMTTDMDITSTFNQQLVQTAGYQSGCEFQVPSPPEGTALDLDSTAVVLRVENQVVLLDRSQTPSCEHGWYFEGDKIKLCPLSCEWLDCSPSSPLLLFAC